MRRTMGTTALHIRVEQYCLEQIQCGKWPPGTQIPTENALASQLGVSRPTVRQAMGRLVSQGLLVRVKGRGSFVTQAKLLHQSTSMLSGYRQESERKGRTIMTEVLRLEVERAGPETADRLSLASGAKVTVLTRLRRVGGYHEGKPVVLTTVSVPYSRFPEMSQLDFTALSFYDAMEERGLEIRRASRELEAAVPEPDVAKLLEISRFEPVLLIRSVGFLADGTPGEYSESCYPAECSKFQIEVTRG